MPVGRQSGVQQTDVLWDRVGEGDQWSLEGNRDLLKRLRHDHDGHDEELTGVVIIPPSPDGTEVHVGSKGIGEKTRVSSG